MKFDQKLKELLTLQRTDPDAFTFELDKPWPDMNSDVEMALAILMEYQNEGKTIRLIEDFHLNEETGELKVLMPEWQMRIISEFNSLFEEEEAQYRFMKTYNEIIGKNLMTSVVN